MRRHVPALSLLGTLVLLPSCHAPGEVPQPEPRTSTPAHAETEVIALQHVSAAEAADVLTDLLRPLDDGSPNVRGDVRTNSVIVHGDAAERARIRGLIATLDVPTER